MNVSALTQYTRLSSISADMERLLIAMARSQIIALGSKSSGADLTTVTQELEQLVEAHEERSQLNCCRGAMSWLLCCGSLSETDESSESPNVPLRVGARAKIGSQRFARTQGACQASSLLEERSINSPPSAPASAVSSAATPSLCRLLSQGVPPRKVAFRPKYHN